MSIEVVLLVAVAVAGVIGVIAFARFNQATLAVEDGKRKFQLEASNGQQEPAPGAAGEPATTNVARTGIRAHGIEAGGSMKARTEGGQPIDAQGIKVNGDLDLTMAAGPEKKNEIRRTGRIDRYEGRA